MRGAVDWVFESPLKSDIEALIASVMVFGGGLWEIISHEGSRELYPCPQKERHQREALFLGHVRKQQEDGHLQSRKWVLIHYQHYSSTSTQLCAFQPPDSEREMSVV